MNPFTIASLVSTMLLIGLVVWRSVAQQHDIGRLRAEIQELREQVSRVARGAQRP